MKKGQAGKTDIECLGCLFCVLAKKNMLKCSKGHELSRTSGDGCPDKKADDGETFHGPNWFKSQLGIE